jgi:hypothetical protein
MVQLVKRSPLGVKVLGSILALMGFLPESETSPSSILTNLGCLSNISNGPEYKKVTMAQLVKRSPFGVKVLGSILALMQFLPQSKTSPSSIYGGKVTLLH